MWPPNIFNDFDGFYTTNPDHGYVKKPSPEIFDLYVFNLTLSCINDIHILFSFHDTFNNDRSKTIVFVDDSPDNVKSSITKDFMGVVYKDAKQLESVLRDMGIDVY